MNMLEIKGLEKRFGEKSVLCGLDMNVPEGSVFGFIGRNGAGKTTTMKAILGLLSIDGGEIFVAGKQVKYGQNVTNGYIGYLPDAPEFYSFMTPTEYLRLCGDCLGMSASDIKKRSEELLCAVGLSDESERRIKGFSRGMKQRLGIAQALIGRPKLLLCDEPTSALDPMGRREILDILVSVKAETTVVFSTHVLSDVERICDRAVLLEQGRAVLAGSMDELKRLNGAREFALETSTESGRSIILSQFSDARSDSLGRLIFNGGDEAMRNVIAFVAEKGIGIERIEKIEPSLESVFMEVMGK